MNPIRNAARLLRESAEELKSCHTLEANGNDWSGEPEAKAIYEEHMNTAEALEEYQAEHFMRSGNHPPPPEAITRDDTVHGQEYYPAGPMRAYLEADRAMRAQAAPAAVAVPSEDVQKKIQSNTWDHFGDILPTLKAISRGEWYWGMNSRCKYIELRIDTRDGGCILYDRDRVRISPEQFAFQAGNAGKMDAWPAKNQIAAAPQPPAAEQPEQDDDADWEIRGKLAASLTCWHRLTGAEADELVTLAKSWSAPRPPVAAQEPVTAQHRFRHPQKTMPDWSVWQPAAIADRPSYCIDSQGYEVEYRLLYTHPAPQPAPVVEGDALDAARYRWLRQPRLAVGHGSIFVLLDDRGKSGSPSKHIFLDELDAAIDAASAQGRQGGK